MTGRGRWKDCIGAGWEIGLGGFERDEGGVGRWMRMEGRVVRCCM